MKVLHDIGYVEEVGIVIWMAVQAVREVDFEQLSLWPVGLAFAAATVWWLLVGRGWTLMLTGRTTRRDLSTWCRTQTLRYLPGGFWAPASRAVMVRGRWLDRIATVAAEQLAALCAALAIGAVALAASGAPLWLPLVLVAAVPPLAARFVTDRTRVSPARTTRATVNYGIAFVAYAIAAVLVQAAVSGFDDPLAVAGASAIAWGAGLVVVITPSGVGVRELVYVALLAPAFPQAELAAAAVALRVVTILAELVVLVLIGRPGSEPAEPAAHPAEADASAR